MPLSFFIHGVSLFLFLTLFRFLKNSHQKYKNIRSCHLGVNIAWNYYGYDFGNHQYDSAGGKLESWLEEIKNNGGNSVRKFARKMSHELVITLELTTMTFQLSYNVFHRFRQA
jgi:hypothetical protein